MNYSCFNPQLGLYEYFEDNAGHPTNGDLPVPTFPAGQAGSVGVPALDAGRRLPDGARPAGRGWHARGMVVGCRGTAVPGLSGGGDAGSFVKDHPVVFLSLATLASYGLWRVAISSTQALSSGR